MASSTWTISAGTFQRLDRKEKGLYSGVADPCSPPPTLYIDTASELEGQTRKESSVGSLSIGIEPKGSEISRTKRSYAIS